MEDLFRQIISLATSAGPLYTIGAIVLLAVLLLAFRGMKITTESPPPPYQPVDNSPPSDGSAPGDVHGGGGEGDVPLGPGDLPSKDSGG